MGYLPDPKTTTIFITACRLMRGGRRRNIIVETRPEFAVLRLQGTKTRHAIAWENIFDVAERRTAENIRLEQEKCTGPRDTTV